MTVQTSVSPSKISQNCDQNNLSVFAFVGDLDNTGHKAPGRVDVKRHVGWKEHPLPELSFRLYDSEGEEEEGTH